jgi:hypothetical protein
MPQFLIWGYIARKLLLGLTSEELWRRLWNNMINEDWIQIIRVHSSRGRRPTECHFTSKGWNILFVKGVKYLGAIFDRRSIWSMQVGRTEAKAFRTFTGIYSLFKSERLRANTKQILHKALIKSAMTLPASPGNLRLTPTLWHCRAWKTSSPHHYWLSKAHTDPRVACGFFKIPYVCDFVTKLCRQQAEVLQKYGNEISQHWTRPHPTRKIQEPYNWRRLSHGRSGDWAVVTAEDNKISHMLRIKPGRLETMHIL